MSHFEQFDKMARRHSLNAYAMAQLMREFIDQNNLAQEFASFAVKMLADGNPAETDDGS